MKFTSCNKILLIAPELLTLPTISFGYRLIKSEYDSSVNSIPLLKFKKKIIDITINYKTNKLIGYLNNFTINNKDQYKAKK